MKISEKQAQVMLTVLIDSLKIDDDKGSFLFSKKSRYDALVEILSQQSDEPFELDYEQNVVEA